ncbi:uncharacterized protein G2W53_012373 [Senna tora]|uniref:Uncharacterized protein n=1 Tax=Senna tora TaxID=362788 RepID=A0A834TWT3_9FABA|nr:uncharacterized protein G2W53_012373 [Senna tora]
MPNVCYIVNEEIAICWYNENGGKTSGQWSKFLQALVTIENHPTASVALHHRPVTRPGQDVNPSNYVKSNFHVST